MLVPSHKLLCRGRAGLHLLDLLAGVPNAGMLGWAVLWAVGGSVTLCLCFGPLELL